MPIAVDCYHFRSGGDTGFRVYVFDLYMCIIYVYYMYICILYVHWIYVLSQRLLKLQYNFIITTSFRITVFQMLILANTFLQNYILIQTFNLPVLFTNGNILFMVYFFWTYVQPIFSFLTIRKFHEKYLNFLWG